MFSLFVKGVKYDRERFDRDRNREIFIVENVAIVLCWLMNSSAAVPQPLSLPISQMHQPSFIKLPLIRKQLQLDEWLAKQLSPAVFAQLLSFSARQSILSKIDNKIDEAVSGLPLFFWLWHNRFRGLHLSVIKMPLRQLQFHTEQSLLGIRCQQTVR